MRDAARYPTWKYRYFRLRYVDHIGFDDWQFGITWTPREVFSHKSAPKPFRALGVMVGHRHYVFDLGEAPDA
jgi:hypothetical protein